MVPSGKELLEWKKRIGVSNLRICVAADDLSLSTLNSVFRDDPSVRLSTYNRVKRALAELEASTSIGTNSRARV